MVELRPIVVKYEVEGSVIVRLETVSSKVAEAHYFRLITRRQSFYGVVVIEPNGNDIDPALYRTDLDWQGAREQEHDRYQKIWSVPLDFESPDVSQIKGLQMAFNLKDQQMADIAGIDVRRWRALCKGKGNYDEMPFSVWYTLLTRLGYFDHFEQQEDGVMHGAHGSSH